MNNQVFNMIGLAKRARKVVSGDTMLKSIQNKSAKLVIIARDASENTQKKYIDKCTFYNIPYAMVDNAADLSHAIGDFNKVAIGILDEGFAKKLESYLKG